MKRIFTKTFMVLLSLCIVLPQLNGASLVSSSTPANPDPATIKSAIESFKSLSRAEKKERMREVKKVVKEFKAAKKAHKEPAASTILQIILAILIPPLGVYLHEGVINSRFWIDLILTLLFFIPGMIYALIVVLGDTKK